MAALPPPPDNVWSDAISASVEGLLSRMEAVEKVTENLVLQAEGHKNIREMQATLLELNDALLISPARKKSKKARKFVIESDVDSEPSFARFNPYPENKVEKKLD